MCVFPVRASGNKEILKSIYPTKQADIQKLLDYASNSTEILMLIVFGSSVTWQCRPNSDIDIAVKYQSNRPFADVAADIRMQMISESDVIDYNDIHDTMLRDEIDKKGVIIYDRSSRSS